MFPGPDSESFRAGRYYDRWVPNDHMILKGKDGRWHAFGITHPEPPADAYIHEGEWMSFHAVSPPGTLREHLRHGAWQDCPKLLPPSERPSEEKEFYAPFIVEKDGLYHMFYSPHQMRLAVSSDLYRWTPKGALFSQDGGMRDPNVIFCDGRYIMVYYAKPAIWARTSTDLLHWSDPVDIFRTERPGELESPVLIARDNLFYLFWCIYDGHNGPFDNRTSVYCSDDPFDFHGKEAIASLPAHAPEVFQDEAGDWYISSAEYPYRGVSIAQLSWK
ncbi:hypothetical protein DLM86_06480 [Paenibacillus flagellatus]|uniref:Glycosyl hydrolase family 32 N-terminal domain-containing protein n=1 Tax=Paenibacillus flagellatus TaxID=2211139 RepID=A0A2V5KAJ7_9BACL|nr:hypothetical protein DLM86_06480 [Paenibacillus flagellatus]